jgi:cytochrome P450
MATTSTDAEAEPLAWDPLNEKYKADPHAIWKRLRDEQPLYFNEQYDFYAVSRFDDAERVMVDRDVFISSKGMVYNIMPFVISGDVEIPKGLFICEDAPLHVAHRGLVSRVFTPKRVSVIEPQIRAFCARVLDGLVGSGGFDWARDLAAQIPMRVIGMLVGIPESDQASIRDHFQEQLNDDTANRDTPPFEDMAQSEDLFGAYLDWRSEHPSDDLMTQLLTLEFEDDSGVSRQLRREEILTYINLIASAGTDTTGRLIGWTGKLLGEHPDQRRELVEDPSLIPNAIEEILRFEPPPYHFGRYVTTDTEFHGQTVPAGSIMIVLPGSANHDEHRFNDPDTFDIHREITRILSFGFGPHLCLGANLARLEGRIVLEEALKRFPDWTVDLDHAELTAGIDTRGWDALPVAI